MDPLRNPKDPIHAAGPEAGRELFRRFGQLATGFPQHAVIDAAINLILNVIRQEHASWSSAEPAYDEKLAKIKSLLRDHYDATGKRRNVFPFDQHVVMSVFDDREQQKARG